MRTARPFRARVVVAVALLITCGTDPVVPPPPPPPEPELELGPVKLRYLDAAAPVSPDTIGARAEIADSGSFPYGSGGRLPVTVWTSTGDTVTVPLPPLVCAGGRLPDGTEVEDRFMCEIVLVYIPLDSAFSHPSIVAWEETWGATLEDEYTPLYNPPPNPVRRGTFRSQRDIHAAVAAAQAIPMVVHASLLSGLGGFPEDPPPPVTVGDFVRVESWWLPWYPVPAVAGDTLTIRYVHPDSTVWQCSFLAPGGSCVFDQRWAAR